jgi:predicted ATP-dependent Lon-type protease
VSREDLAEILGLAIEGRRRVKEQLKKMGAFEYHQTSFSYQVNETGEECFVGVPEQGGRDMISSDPLSPGTNKVEAELGVAFFVAAYSILRKAASQPGLVVLGDLSVQGNVKAVRSLTEPLQVAMDNGAKRALIPSENKRQLFDVHADVLEQVDPIFFGDLRQAAFKALGLG